ncbi:uncharacterized protein LOC128222684 [Mya arenaria]|uniref:uncharacterized protein LOC128222684 n=1 Tax=Mya arenaria TaxID=6604 RepID=UPI0022E8BC62|nr:uncharacterized protein LOC128222684 [Mya arenaria]XP_052787731.1 uncharacterized protein LOC128222684 [Mya arenaria]
MSQMEKYSDGCSHDKYEDSVAGRIVAGVCDGEVPGRLPSTDGFIFGRSDDCVAGRIISDQYVGAAFCGVLTTRICRCTNGIRAGLLLLGDGCYSLCTIQFLLRLVFPLCSMSIAISSVVLPYWAWGETDDVAVGLFKCCNFTEENSNSNISECSPLSDCFPSESNVYSLIKAAAGLQITYIVVHGITILLTTISQLIRDSDERKRCQFYNGMVVFFAATICFISIIVSFSGVIQSHSLEGVPPLLSINLAIFSCAVYISYAGVCFREPRLCICVPISIAVNYLAIYMMTNKLVLKSVSVVGGLAIACLLIYLIFARPDRCRTNF